MRKYIIVTSYLLLMSLSSPIFAWASTGHRIIADIAYSRLTPSSKQRVDKLTYRMFKSGSGRNRFLRASVWPDQLKLQGVHAFDSWHYINTPYSSDGQALPDNAKANKENVAWAIQQSYSVITNRKAQPREKAMFLSFLVHFVGDAHQPLHCITRYNKSYPEGGLGGNLVPIRTPYEKTLHSYWDNGVGLFHIKGQRYPLSYRLVGQMAKQISTEYPPAFFQGKAKNMSPYEWTHDCFLLAKKHAYKIKAYGTPSSAYVKMGQKIVKQQIALSGYRLASMLNQAFSHRGDNDD